VTGQAPESQRPGPKNIGFQDAIGQAKGSVDVMLKLIAGEKGEDMDIPFILVTKDNVDQYIK
jgi:ABC-type sugar transport system substrate-binding protein